MKPLTATLIAQAVEHGTLAWDSSIEHSVGIGYLPPDFHGRAVTLRHLLSHSHGWDDAAIRCVPRYPDGRIDLRELFREIGSSPPLASAGARYNYGNAGAWVSAALLEHATQTPYKRLLFDHLLAPLGLLSDPTANPEKLCPARDLNFTIPLETALRFLELHIAGGHLRAEGTCAAFSPEGMRAWSLPLPGWSPAERRVCLGWMDYGSGWYGHDARDRGYTASMRFNPEHSVACTFFGEGEGAFDVFNRIFAKHLPELYDSRLPRMHRHGDASPLDLSPYQANFENSISRISVSRTADGRLQYRLDHDPQALEGLSTDQPTVLIPASAHIFFPANPVPPGAELQFLQFLTEAPGNAFEYLWNGRNLWKRSKRSGDGSTAAYSAAAGDDGFSEEDLIRLMGRC